MSGASTAITAFGTTRSFFTKGGCSETMMSILDRAFGHPLESEEHASIPFSGGIVQQGYQCGMLWGATLAAGAEAYRRLGSGPRAEAGAMEAARRLVESFHACNEHRDCFELTEVDFSKKSQLAKYFLKGGPVSCVRRAIRFAPAAREAIDSALSAVPDTAPSGCASCAAKLARKLGADDKHAIMAAGLAGGIGQSGGACGALGAAMWITGMNNPEEKIGYSTDGTKVGELIEEFLQRSDHRFECEEIVGRVFESVEDHARHVRTGGCAELIDGLVAAARADGARQGERLSA